MLATGTLGSASGGHPVRWVATGRSGGVSRGSYASLNLSDRVGDASGDVARNRAAVAEAAGVEPSRIATLVAEHGGRVAIVTEPGDLPGFDAAVTSLPGLALLALAADCVPLALADPQAGVIGVVHCGWRGLVAGVVPNALTAMAALGAGRVEAVLGPSICADCYPVPADRVATVRDSVTRQVADAACRSRGGQHAIDVAAGVLAELARAGVAATRMPGCTAESADLFSYRRDGVTGRQGMIVVR